MKSRFSRECSATEFFVSNLSGKVRFGVPFWDPVDFEGGPKIMFSGIMFGKNEKKEVQERFQENMKVRWIFDSKMGAFDMLKSCSRTVLVAKSTFSGCGDF